ncbi:MAG: PAS domain-containing protein [Desulfurivibrio sp.]|nr:PAS domain-containing protein [Desulfurivibrio sp.]MBU4119614.1 GAF domain-containing protein [Pseudomonadota bacterium]
MTSLANGGNPPEDFGLSEDSWRNTFDAVTDFVSVLDRDYRIVKVNKALAEFLHKKPEELIGKYCFEMMHGRTSHWEGCPHDQMMQEGKAITLAVDDPHIGIPLLVTASPIFDSGGNLVGSVHVAKDISTVRKIQDDLAVRNQQLEVLNRLTRRAITSQSLKEVVQVALDGVIMACSPDLALYYMIADDWLILQGVFPAEEEHIVEKKKVGMCLCGLAAEKGVSVFSYDIHCDARCTLKECKEAGIRSFAAVPIMHNHVVVGVLGIASKSEKRYSDEQEFLETLAATVGIVSQNALMIEKIRNETDILEQKVVERTRELEEKNEELERFNKLFVDREFRIKELRDQVAELKENITEGKDEGQSA